MTSSSLCMREGSADLQSHPSTLLPPTPTKQVHAILEATTHGGDKTLEGALFSHADAVTTRFFGNEIYYRGIVEFSNVCQNDCGYCGIRKHMTGVKRWERGGEHERSIASILALLS